MSLELVILLNPQLLQWIIDQIIPTQNESSLSILALSFVFILAFQVILDLARENLNIFMKFNISLKWQANIVSKILDLPVDFLKKINWRYCFEIWINQHHIEYYNIKLYDSHI